MRKKLFAELIGTFILVFAGTGAIMINDIAGAIGHVGIALTFGFVIVALIYSFAHVSGAHFNPAVTIAFWSMGEFERKNVFPYIFAQILGAVIASSCLYLLLNENCVISHNHIISTTPDQRKSYSLSSHITHLPCHHTSHVTHIRHDGGSPEMHG